MEKSALEVIEIFTDGACLGNPGPGGYAALLRYKASTKTLTQGFRHTTNNRMELMGAIAGLNALTRYDLPVHLYSDSRYLCQAMESWLQQWRSNGWKNVARETVSNRDLWQKLDTLSQQFSIKWYLIKGHSGHAENEYCDKMAKAAAKSPSDRDVGYEAMSKRGCIASIPSPDYS